MPSWKSFDVFGEATDQIAQTAVKAINARRQERQREAAFQNLRSYLGQRFNKPAAAPKQPGLGPQGEAPAQLNEGATAGRN